MRHAFDIVDSTQTVAAGMARDGAEAGTYVIARAQRAGRGRLDHTWTSPPGGLYLSLIAAEPARALSLAPLAFGLAVADTVAAYGVTGALRWPNDVVVVAPPNGTARKLAGVLVDRVLSPRLGHALVIGVGLNVAAHADDFPPALRPDVVQLNELARAPQTVDAVEAELVPRVRASVEMLRTDGGALTTVARCRAALYGRGRSAVLDGRPVGRIDELDEDGSLWVRGANGRENVRAGRLEVLPA